jgi:hypothetical protein
MAHFLNDLVVDVAAQYLIDNVTRVVLCDGAPTNYADANTDNGSGSGVKMSQTTVDDSDFALANGDADGRKVTLNALNAVAITAAGDADHIAWLDTVNEDLLFVTPLASAATGLTTDSVVNIPAHFHVFRDATAVA